MFALPPGEHSLFARYLFELCGRGAHQVVYRSPYADRVYKVAVADITALLAYNLQFAGRPLCEAPAQLGMQNETVLNVQREQSRALQAFLGPRVLDEECYSIALPVPGRSF